MKLVDSGSESALQTNGMRPLVLAGPSGSGKSTLVKKLLANHGKVFELSVSHTTRQPRPGEVNGESYHFVTREEMKIAIDNGELIEYTEFSGNTYGTSKRAVRDVMDKGRVCILDIEIEGVRNIKNTDLNPHYIFIKPPSLEVLEERLRLRNTETEESIARRLERAVIELEFSEKEGFFDLVIVNDNLKVAYDALENFLIKVYPDFNLSQEIEKHSEKRIDC